MNKAIASLFAIIFLFSMYSKAQNLMVTYAGNSGNESFNDVLQLSNGHFIVVGVADDLDWISASVPRVMLPNPGISNNLGTGKIAFLAEYDASLQNILAVYHLPPNAAEDFRFLKTTNRPGEPTGEIYLSGNTEDSQTGGYFIAKLDQNFVAAAPTGFSWVENIKAATGQYPDTYQPWDVGSDGKVVFAFGDSHAYNWSAIYRLKSDGSDDVVPNWRVHWPASGGEFYGNADDYPGGATGLLYSAIVFKRDAGRCELRSTNQTDFDLWQSDGNGGSKKGKWPMDVLFDTPCLPGVPGNTTNGPGYTGYSPAGTFTHGPSSICIDRRSNDMYIGFNFKSVLPDGQPDFEPAVMAMDADGSLRWWSRLYHEVRPDGDTMVSTPDQYVDALAIDYSKPANDGELVVGARCHGNNVENLWEGNAIAANPNANGFQNRFTGSAGNIHISWIGKLKTADGTLLNSTFMAEYAEGTGGLGTAHPDPNLDGWPNPNDGWPDVNTTYMAKNMLKTTADGSVLVLGIGRRTITTANAYQKMVKPANGGLSAWNNFVRMYSPTLSKPLYSSLVVGQWDTLTQQGGGNVNLYGSWKTATGIVAVGKHTGSGNELPVVNVPAWGNAHYSNESAVLVHYTAANIVNPADGPNGMVGVTQASIKASPTFQLYPNPAFDRVSLEMQLIDSHGTVTVFNSLQHVVGHLQITSNKMSLDCSRWENGVYWVCLVNGIHTEWQKLVVNK
jgi:hypothetical protein